MNDSTVSEKPYNSLSVPTVVAILLFDLVAGFTAVSYIVSKWSETSLTVKIVAAVAGIVGAGLLGAYVWYQHVNPSIKARLIREK